MKLVFNSLKVNIKPFAIISKCWKAFPEAKHLGYCACILLVESKVNLLKLKL